MCLYRGHLKRLSLPIRDADCCYLAFIALFFWWKKKGVTQQGKSNENIELRKTKSVFKQSAEQIQRKMSRYWLSGIWCLLEMLAAVALVSFCGVVWMETSNLSAKCHISTVHTALNVAKHRLRAWMWTQKRQVRFQPHYWLHWCACALLLCQGNLWFINYRIFLVSPSSITLLIGWCSWKHPFLSLSPFISSVSLHLPPYTRYLSF